MLVLTRKKDERIMIGDQAEVVITIVEIRGNSVRLGFECKHRLPVYREEVFKAQTLMQLKHDVSTLQLACESARIKPQKKEMVRQ
ncbi:MAG: carbon storage regulator [Gammaproteobacteria bacterium]|nr:carbon storage regulator [Gammaproteobacteria bacterium]